MNSGTPEATGNGKSYTMLVFRKVRTGLVNPDYSFSRPLRSRTHLWVPAGGYIDCGTSDTLSFPNRAYTLEWFGAHASDGPERFTQPGPGNGQLVQLPLLWRQNGADAVAGNASWGLMIAPPMAPGQDAQIGTKVLWFMVGDTVNFPVTLTDLYQRCPITHGRIIRPHRATHIMVTHNGSGRYAIYVDGKIYGERNIDMANAPTPQTNGGSGAGHRTTMFARQRGGVSPDHNTYGGILYLARAYGRDLTAVECAQNHAALFADNDIPPVADFAEEWKAVNTTGTTLAATVNPANNGTLVGAIVKRGIL